MALVSRETGEVRSVVIPDVTGENLKWAIMRHTWTPEVHLHTDGSFHYAKISKKFKSHETVDHAAGEWVRGDVSTNQAENYFSQLKRSIDGTHHHVSVDHLPRYLAEFDFRYTHRKDTDTERMYRLVRRVAGRRMMYREPGLGLS